MRIVALTPYILGNEIACLAQSQSLFKTHLFFNNPDWEWNDYGSRLQILARAASLYYQHVVWIDSDELFDSGVTCEVLETLFLEMTQRGCIAVRFQVKEMWNDHQWRCDGVWATKCRIVLQHNPLMDESVHWRNNPKDSRFHAFPLQIGDIMDAPYAILHYGMSTPVLRKARYEKWKRLDPNCRYQPQGYDYMLDDTGLQLADATPMKP